MSSKSDSLSDAASSYSLRGRIVRDVVISSGVTAFIVLVLIFVVSWRYLVGDYEKGLADIAEDICGEYEKGGGDTPEFRSLMADYADEFSSPLTFVLLADDLGALLYSTKAPEDVRARILELVARGIRTGRVTAADSRLLGDASAIRFMAVRLSDGKLLAVGVDVTPVERFLVFLMLSLVVGFILMVGGAALITSAFASRLVRCMDRVAETASAIESGDWSRRVGEDGIRVREVLALIRMFNSMCEKNEHTLAELRVLTDDIAHDLRTPLSRLAMAAEAEATKGSAGGALPDTVVDEVSAMLELINTMLDISQTDARMDRSQRTELDLAAIVNSSADLYLPLAEQNGIALSADVPPGPVLFTGHKKKLQQLLGNLIENAIKFTPRGGRVAVSLSTADGEIVLRVSDTGCGISAADLTNVFKRFWRADSSRSLPGNGLGLALVKAIVTSYGGHVYCESTLGNGSVFTVRLQVGGEEGSFIKCD